MRILWLARTAHSMCVLTNLHCWLFALPEAWKFAGAAKVNLWWFHHYWTWSSVKAFWLKNESTNLQWLARVSRTFVWSIDWRCSHLLLHLCFINSRPWHRRSSRWCKNDIPHTYWIINKTLICINDDKALENLLKSNVIIVFRGRFIFCESPGLPGSRFSLQA